MKILVIVGRKEMGKRYGGRETLKKAGVLGKVYLGFWLVFKDEIEM